MRNKGLIFGLTGPWGHTYQKAEEDLGLWESPVGEWKGRGPGCLRRNIHGLFAALLRRQRLGQFPRVGTRTPAEYSRHSHWSYEFKIKVRFCTCAANHLRGTVCCCVPLSHKAIVRLVRYAGFGDSS